MDQQRLMCRFYVETFKPVFQLDVYLTSFPNMTPSCLQSPMGSHDVVSLFFLIRRADVLGLNICNVA